MTESTTGPELVDTTEVATASIRETVAMADIRDFFDRSFATLGAVLGEQGVTPTGAAYGLYHGQPADTIDVEVGFPVARAVKDDRGVRSSTLPAGRVARLVHEGSFDGLSDSWQRLVGWLIAEGEQPGPIYWEVYLTEPSPDMDPAELRTELNCLLAVR